MKKIFLPIILFCLVAVLFVPILIQAQGIVTCDTNCGISDFFGMLGKIYDFIVKDIATPLAVIALTIGGILMMISAGNPNLMATGKKVLYAAIIGLFLVWGSWLIINFVLTTLGYSGDWSNP